MTLRCKNRLWFDPYRDEFISTWFITSVTLKTTRVGARYISSPLIQGLVIPIVVIKSENSGHWNGTYAVGKNFLLSKLI